MDQNNYIKGNTANNQRAYGTAERDSYVIVMLIPNVANVIYLMSAFRRFYHADWYLCLRIKYSFYRDYFV